MHQEAERGIAAHWAYTEAGKPKKGHTPGRKFSWISQLRNWHNELRKDKPSAEELLEALKIDFFRDRIFVLTPKGDVIDLPQGATPLDFAYHIHSEVGNRATGAKVNDRLVSFSWELKSGDVVEIITQKKRKPTPEWLGVAKTALAKNRIRRSLRASPANSFLTLDAKLVEAHVFGKNRVGFIKDITSVFAKRKVNIQNLISARSGSEESPIKITFVIRNKEELEKIAKKLRAITGVIKVNCYTK
jgi:(p)ppGpp synthase/HD superfamily hydrolase